MNDKTSGRMNEEKKNAQRRLILTPEERRSAVAKKYGVRARRVIETNKKFNSLKKEKPSEKKFYTAITDKIRMWRLGITVNVDSIVKGLVIGGLIIVFAMLQTTVFSKLRPFGATPDLMLPLVIAVGIAEGERWGGVTGLAAAFIIDCLGSAGLTLLPLLYVPCGFAAGLLGTYYLRDSFVIRAIFTVASGVLRGAVTALYLAVTYDSPDASLAFRTVIAPEFLSTLVFAVLPHAASYFALKPFHKTRAERVGQK